MAWATDVNEPRGGPTIARPVIPGRHDHPHWIIPDVFSIQYACDGKDSHSNAFVKTPQRQRHCAAGRTSPASTVPIRRLAVLAATSPPAIFRLRAPQYLYVTRRSLNFRKSNISCSDLSWSSIRALKAPKSSAKRWNVVMLGFVTPSRRDKMYKYPRPQGAESLSRMIGKRLRVPDLSIA